jgi:hypothetical protein
MEQPSKTAGNRRWAIATWILVAVITVVAGFAAFTWLANGPLPFDRAQWDATYDLPSDTTRHRMADGLVQSKALIGKSRSEIAELLGPPEERVLWPEHWDTNYYLGPCRHIVGIDTEFLVLKFDGNGIVTTAGVTED